MSDMCLIKAILLSLSLFLPVAASFCIYQAYTGKKVRHHSKIKSQGRCANQYKKCCLNGGEHFNLNDEDIVSYKSTMLCGGKRCERYIWWAYFRI